MATETARAGRAEHRWPAVVGLLIALTLYALLPSEFLPALRYSVVATGALLLLPLIAINPLRFHKQTRWSRLLSLSQVVLLVLANSIALVQLILLLLEASKEDGPTLLLAALQVWVTHVIAFALLYWELDRGGPVVRTQAARAKLPNADIRFPQDEDHDSVVEVAAGSSAKSDWTANFIDYLYFSASNAMAFSPPDAMPLTQRMKALVGFQAFGAYVILVLVIARAVSLLG